MKYYVFLFILFLTFSCQKKNPDGNPGNNGNDNPPDSLFVYKDSIVTNFFKRESGWTAGDGAYSIPLSNGKALWTFGDSFVDHYDTITNTLPCLFQVHNCSILQPYGDWNWRHSTTLLGHTPGVKSFYKNNPNDHYWFWPTGGFQVGDTAYVFLNNLKKKPGGTGGLGSIENGGPKMFAKVKIPDMKVVEYMPIPGLDSVGFGSSFVKDESSGYIYIYGGKLIVTTENIASDIYVARVPISNPSKAWEFWTGKDWSSNIREKKKIGTGGPLTNGINITKIKDKYVLLSAEFSVGCDQGKKIFAAIGDAPTGPFSNSKVLYTIPDTLQGHYPFFYGVHAHPEYINDKNELLITYCINGYGNCIKGCKNNRRDPKSYRPRGIRAPLKLLFSE